MFEFGGCIAFGPTSLQFRFTKQFIWGFETVTPLTKYFHSRNTGRERQLQLLPYLENSDLLPTYQSGFRANHSTETVLLSLLSADIYSAIANRSSLYWPCSMTMLLSTWSINKSFLSVLRPRVQSHLSLFFGSNLTCRLTVLK